MSAGYACIGERGDWITAGPDGRLVRGGTFRELEAVYLWMYGRGAAIYPCRGCVPMAGAGK
jgi:hypothetical protein